MELDCCFEKDNKWFRYRAAAIIVEDDCVLLASNEVDDYFYSVGGGIHHGETAEEAVRREVYEETGVLYEIDRLAIIHENFFDNSPGQLKGKSCHEVALYFRMESRGIREFNAESYTMYGIKETVEWIPISDLDKYEVYPLFLKEYLENDSNEILHIVTDQRE